MNTLENKIQFSYNNSKKIIKLISEIDMFKGKWSILENMSTSFLNELKNIATIQSIGSSTRIEGAVLSDQDIKELISGLDINKLETRDEQEVIGYFDALELILENYRDFELSENYIKQLHSILLKYSDKDKRRRGIYKKLTNRVVATYPNGTQKVIFNTTEPHLVRKKMEEIITWTRQNIHENKIHPLIVIGLFVYEFLSIHPFHDGNGRLSRLLTTLLLLRQDYNFIKYVSFEHVIEERKKDYYASLMECQKNRNTIDERIDNWIIFFLDALKTLTAELEVKVRGMRQDKSVYLNERQKKIISFVKTRELCKIGDIHKSFSDISINTLKKDMKYLVENHILEKTGQRKGTIYHFSRYFYLSDIYHIDDISQDQIY